MIRPIKIISDSTADLPKELVEKYDIEVLPLHIASYNFYPDSETVNVTKTYSFIPNANIFLAALIAACFIWLILAVIFNLTKKTKEN